MVLPAAGYAACNVPQLLSQRCINVGIELGIICMWCTIFLPFIVTIRVLARLIDGMMYRTLHLGDDITRGLVMQSAVKHLIMTKQRFVIDEFCSNRSNAA